MKKITLNLGTQTVELATNLRVAYVLQGMNNHKPYLEIFKGIDKLPIEGQISFLYAAYTVACTSEPMSKEVFLNMCLDNIDVANIMNHIKEIIEGITGKALDENSNEVSESTQAKN